MIIDGELGTDRAKDLAIYCWGHIGHYAVDGPTLNRHAETVDIVGLQSTLLPHQHVHKDFALPTRMPTANCRLFYKRLTHPKLTPLIRRARLHVWKKGGGDVDTSPYSLDCTASL